VQGLANIDATSTKMAGLVNDLLDSAGVQLGQGIELDRDRSDLVALIGGVAAEHQQATDRHRIRVDALPPELVGNWDTQRLERVLSNLIGNAVKYSPNGGEVRVTIRCEDGPPGRWAVVRVHDEGLGIPAADMSRIFERFHRARNVRGHIGGTGIGLTGARSIVEGHGGTITVESQEGAGSTFTLRLPVDSEEADGADPRS
jgi:signal transduction histidine kinase